MDEPLQDGDERFRLLVESVVDYAIFMLDAEGYITTWNAGAERLKGYRPNEIIGEHFSRFYSEADRERGHPQHELKLAASQGRYEEEGWRVRKDGTHFWANVVITALRDQQSQLRGFAKVTRDLTERKKGEDALLEARAELEERVRVRTLELARLNEALQQEIAARDETEKALRRREQELTDFLENATVGIHWVGVNGTILWANQAELDLLGYRREEYIGRHIAEFHADAPVIDDILQRLLCNETLHDYEARLRCKDGSIRHVLINSNVYWVEGKFQYTRCFTRDITPRRLAEDALRAREAELRLVTDAVPALIALIDTNGRYRLANRGYAEWFGLSQPEFRGKHQRELFGDEIWPKIQPHTEAVLRGETTTFECELPHQDGTFRWIRATYTPHQDDEGAVLGFITLLQDFTERKQHLETLQDQREELEVANEELQVANEELADQQAELAAANYELQQHQQQLLQTTTALRRSEAALQDRTQTLETVNHIGQLLTAELELDKLLQALTDAATEISEAQFGAFFYNTVDEQGESYVVYTLSGAPREAFANFPLPRNTAIFAPTFAGQGTMRLTDVTQDPRFGKNAPYYGVPEGHLPLRSYLAVPVRSRRGDVLGALFFGHAKAGVFTERHAGLVEGVAAQAAIAVDNARLYQQARAAEAMQEQRAREAALIAEVGVALSHIADLPAMLGRVTDALTRHFDATFACIWTSDEAQQALELRASSEPSTHQYGPLRRIQVGTGKIGLVAAERKPHLTNEILTDLRVSEQEWAKRESLVAFAGFPLLIGDRLLGVMALFARRPLAQEALGILGSVADILSQGIERKRLEAEVQKRAEALAEADLRKDEFLAMLGHELRNPLAPALTALHVLKEHAPDEPAFARARDVAERQLRNMTRIVDDLLDVSRITRGKIELRKAPLDLGALVRRVAETLRPQIEARRHLLICSIPEMPVPILADLTRIDQVLVNLLTNAAKYTDPGGTIWLTLEQEGLEAVVRVRDTGVGIPKKLLPHLFELFVQNERSLDRAQGGLGIGLTLVKRLVEMHGGSVEASSAGLNQGSQFTVCLPIIADALQNCEPDPASLPVVTSPHVTQPQRSYRLLVVDDNHDAAETLAEFLEDLGHTIICAHDGTDAIEKAHQEYPLDAILMDIGLPNLNGYEVAQCLRAEDRFQSTVLIALTGYGTAEDQRRSREAGFNHHLVKPVEPGALLQLLEELLTAPKPS